MELIVSILHSKTHRHKKKINPTSNVFQTNYLAIKLLFQENTFEVKHLIPGIYLKSFSHHRFVARGYCLEIHYFFPNGRTPSMLV